MRYWKGAFVFGCALLGACGGTTTSSGGGGTSGFVITIQSMTFSPASMHVPPGATVTVMNLDGSSGLAHSVTSEAALDSFTPGAVSGVQFDTGLFTTGTPTFTIPPTAPSGTVIYYFCRNHLNTMHGAAGINSSQGIITVQPGATAPSTTDGGTTMPSGGGY